MNKVHICVLSFKAFFFVIQHGDDNIDNVPDLTSEEDLTSEVDETSPSTTSPLNNPTTQEVTSRRLFLSSSYRAIDAAKREAISTDRYVSKVPISRFFLSLFFRL